MIKAIIFDCFGVLVGQGFDDTYRYAGGDSHADHEFIEELFEENNRGQITQDEFKQAICKRLGITLAVWEQATEQAELPNIELLEYIQQLHKQYKTAILSNVNVGVLERKIPAEWLNMCFDELVVSAEVGYIKPEPEIYEYAAKKLGVEPSECVFVDDRQGYVEASQMVGMQGILYKDFAQLKAELAALLAANPN